MKETRFEEEMKWNIVKEYMITVLMFLVLCIVIGIAVIIVKKFLDIFGDELKEVVEIFVYVLDHLFSTDWTGLNLILSIIFLYTPLIVVFGGILVIVVGLFFIFIIKPVVFVAKVVSMSYQTRKENIRYWRVLYKQFKENEKKEGEQSQRSNKDQYSQGAERDDSYRKQRTYGSEFYNLPPEFIDAKIYFMDWGCNDFTSSSLKKFRNELIKKYHPDNGGDIKTIQDINNAYEILVKYAHSTYRNAASR